ncbi:hypothetical protein WJX84_002194 [Apatococcus fuscideae]|uniref:N-acetyltransferase domain-containing protein n=1 Tax=Apatococcus fuscideae TaxID=2026836 RepID=A0AAW1SWA6_9CHLO
MRLGCSDRCWSLVQQPVVLRGLQPFVRQPGHRRLRAESAGFHEARLAAAPRRSPKSLGLDVAVRPAKGPEELQAAAVLRALSFYAYPPERAYAGQIHQQMQADSEFNALIEMTSEELRQLDNRLRIGSEAVVGTLDLYSAHAPPGQVLIGNSRQAAYLGNVCSCEAVRRQGVGSALLRTATAYARTWGADNLYVHIKAVNTSAEEFYRRFGFVKEKEESANDAHYRGHCLDGVEGKGRTALLRLQL